jgi:hypothetical protein
LLIYPKKSAVSKREKKREYVKVYLIELLGEKDIPYFQHILGNWIKYGRRGEEGIEIILFLYLDHQEGRIFFYIQKGLGKKKFQKWYFTCLFIVLFDDM